MFVDTMLEVQPLQKQMLSKLKDQLNPDQDKDTLINQANQTPHGPPGTSSIARSGLILKQARR